MLEVQIKTSLPESCVLGALNEILNQAVMEIEGLTQVNDEIKGLLNVRARKIEDLIENLPSYCEGISLSSKEAKVLVKEHTCLLAHSIIASGCLITKASVDGREIVWNVICDDESFLQLMKNLEETEVDFEILYKGRPAGEKSKITYREEEILKIALERGFFDFPKRIKLEELADIFGIAPSTLSEILRRGQKKILKSYFGI
ncbi:MAG: helix-turn-helix domain-containing protein [Archaeoglobus sp.]|nr:helix-turn-helix domain-containing protein [Archaeoglobus sp.]